MTTLSRYLGKSPELESSRLKDNKNKQQETKIYKNKNVTMRLFFPSYYCLLVNYYFSNRQKRQKHLKFLLYLKKR